MVAETPPFADLDPETLELWIRLLQAFKEFREKQPEKFKKLFEEEEPGEVENFVSLFLQNLENVRVKKGDQVVSGKQMVEELYSKYGEQLPTKFMEEIKNYPTLMPAFINALIRTFQQISEG